MSKLNYDVKTFPLSMALTYNFTWGLYSAFLFTLGLGFQWEKINAMFTSLSQRWCHVSYFNGNIGNNISNISFTGQHRNKPTEF